MAEHHWLFRMTNGADLSGNCGIDYFESRAKTMAAMFDCTFVCSKDVMVEHWHNNVVMVSGIAILEGTARYPDGPAGLKENPAPAGVGTGLS